MGNSVVQSGDHPGGVNRRKRRLRWTGGTITFDHEEPIIRRVLKIGNIEGRCRVGLKY